MGILQACVLFLRAMLVPKSTLAIENLALRQQVAMFKQSVKRPKLRPRDRVFWVWLCKLWPNRQSALAFVQPDTVIRWHRPGVQVVLALEIEAGTPGRPPIASAIS